MSVPVLLALASIVLVVWGYRHWHGSPWKILSEIDPDPTPKKPLGRGYVFAVNKVPDGAIFLVQRYLGEDDTWKAYLRVSKKLVHLTRQQDGRWREEIDELHVQAWSGDDGRRGRLQRPILPRSGDRLSKPGRRQELAIRDACDPGPGPAHRVLRARSRLGGWSGQPAPASRIGSRRARKYFPKS